jgi:RNA polymerase sigma-70 factor (ECF subfamily)
MMREHFHGLWRTARRFGFDEGRAEDLAQRAFVIAASKLSTIEIGKERAFLFGVIAKLCADARKNAFCRRSVPAHDVIERMVDPSAGPLGEVLLAEACTQLDQALLQLPGDLRDAFVLVEIEELTVVEVAEALQLAPGTVASRIRRARARLRMILSDWVADDRTEHTEAVALTEAEATR